MKPYHRHSHLSRRRLLQFLGAASAIGLTGGITSYSLEQAQRTPPFSKTIGQTELPHTIAPHRGTPLLLVINTRSPSSFGYYLGEILRAEGINSFQTVSVKALNYQSLAQFAVVLLTEGSIDPAEADLLKNYVINGGNLITIYPDPVLAPLLGVTFLGKETVHGYLQADINHPISQGIAHHALQFHGPMVHIHPNSAEVIAWFSNDAGIRTNLPLVTLNRLGKGHIAAWAFNLAHSIALTRQGNPEWVNQDRDNIAGSRAVDLFNGWVDLDRIGIPQADEQQRLFVNMLHSLATKHIPLPRLWYFPSPTNTVLILTGDAHGSEVVFIEEVLHRAERYGAQMSIYYTPREINTIRRMLRKMRWYAMDLPIIGSVFAHDDSLPTPRHVATWRERGHEFSMHPYVEQGLEQGYNEHWNMFIKLGYDPISPTVRTHRILWYGWVENARIQSQYGIRMNLDHYHIGETVRKLNGEWVHGYLTGSGLPLRFVDENGTVLNVYQQHTHLVDEHLMNVFDTKQDIGLNGDQAIAVTVPTIADSLQRYPAALGLQCHIDPFTFGGDKAHTIGRWLEGVLEYAAEHSIPIMSAERWLTFTEMRAATHIDNLMWEPNQGLLSFELTTPQTIHPSIEMMLPLEYAEYMLRQVHINGTLTGFKERKVGGIRYAVFQIPTGKHSINGQYGS